MKENYLWPELEKRQRELERLRKEIAILRDALEILCKEVREAHVDRNNLTPGCAVCDAIKEGEQALAGKEEPIS